MPVGFVASQRAQPEPLGSADSLEPLGSAWVMVKRTEGSQRSSLWTRETSYNPHHQRPRGRSKG